MTDQPTIVSRLTAEFVGTAFLLIGVVGSGIMAAKLSEDVGLQLFQNAFATAGILIALILSLAGVSGAQFNPVVTLFDRFNGGMDTKTAVQYIAAQTTGGIVGVILANLMFDLDPIFWSTTDRSSANLLLSEVIATIGLLLIIFGTVRSGNGQYVSFAVGTYIGGAYYFTSSTSFANPAVTIARMFSDTFAGIEPASAPGFIVAQLIGLGIGVAIINTIYPTK